MPRKSALSTFWVICAGALAGFLVWEIYWLFSGLNLIPKEVWTWIISSSLGRAIHEISPDLDVHFLVTINALLPSILTGGLIGYVLPRVKLPHIFCYSTWLWPLAYFTFTYFTIAALDTINWRGTQPLWQAWQNHIVIAIAVYIWYFIGMYGGLSVARWNNHSSC
jgi:hypothetical protein